MLLKHAYASQFGTYHKALTILYWQKKVAIHCVACKALIQAIVLTD